MKDLNRPKKEDYDFNDNIEGVRYAKDMNDYADKLEEQLRLYVVSSSYAVQKVHFYSMISTYLKASEEVENGIYDPIEDALQEIQQKYLIIQKE